MSSAPFDLLLSGGTLVTGRARLAGDLGVRDGRIVAIGAPGELGTATRDVFDARGTYVLPGLVDSHVHFREPGLEYKEDIVSGSLGAVMGGITTVLDMPNTLPPTASAELVRDKLRRIEGRAFCDIGVLGLAGPDTLPELESMAEAGAIGYKCFLGETTGALAPPDDGALLDALRITARLGRRLAFHAENNAILQHSARALKAAGRTDALAHLEARPVVAEVEAIQRVGLFAQHTGAAVHICHLSSAAGLAAVRAWQRQGIDLTCETAAHYVFLNASDLARLGSQLRTNPPVRQAEDAAALLRGLADGGITCIASDHAPHAPAEKLHADVWQASSGVVGVETTLRLFLTYAVHTGTLSLEQLVRLMAEAPARAWGIYPRKGALQVGADADFTLVDLERSGRIEGATLHGRSRLTPFDGWPVRGEPVATILRGELVMRDGELVGPPRGRPVVPTSL